MENTAYSDSLDVVTWTSWRTSSRALARIKERVFRPSPSARFRSPFRRRRLFEQSMNRHHQCQTAQDGPRRYKVKGRCARRWFQPTKGSPNASDKVRPSLKKSRGTVRSRWTARLLPRSKT